MKACRLDITHYRGKGIFADCISLRTVDIGNLATVCQSMFKDCDSLEEMKQPVGNIYDEAFSGCISLKRITLSTNCRYIEESAFENCSNLEIIRKEETKKHNLHLLVNIHKRNLEERIERIKQNKKDIIEKNGNEKQVMSSNLRLERTEIEHATLSELQSDNCSFIYQVDISSKAFKGCTKLINIYADEVYINGGETFANCKKMKTFFLAWSIPIKIHEPSVEFCKTFENCGSLEFCSIIFHREYGRYNRDNFLNTELSHPIILGKCPPKPTILTKESYEEYQKRMAEAEKNGEITVLRFNKKEVREPEYSNIYTKVKEIKYEKTFKNCHKLIHVGHLLVSTEYKTIIENETFYGCTNLKTIGNGVLIYMLERIGDKAFYNCKELYMSDLFSSKTTFSKNALLGSNLKIVQYPKNPDMKKLISQ